MSSDRSDPLDKIREKDIKKLSKLNLIKLSDDGGGSEFAIDKNSKRIYFWDHDYTLMPDSITIKQYLNMGK